MANLLCLLYTVHSGPERVKTWPKLFFKCGDDFVEWSNCYWLQNSVPSKSDDSQSCWCASDMSCSMSFEIPDVRLRGRGLKFVMNGSNDTRREWIKSVFIDILEHFLEYLSRYAFSYLCNDSYASSDSWPVGSMAAATTCAPCINCITVSD